MKKEIVELAKFMHNEYEKFSKKVGWNTQDKCKVEFKDLPPENREVMLLVASSVLKLLKEKQK